MTWLSQRITISWQITSKVNEFVMNISPIPAFNDNYLWLLQNDSGHAFVVDPGDAEPVIARLAADGLVLDGILVTHHHGDHVGGVVRLLDAFPGIPVYGSAQSDADCVSHPLREGDTVTVLGSTATVLEVPGHTLDHIAYFFAEAGDGLPALFCGDTLFVGGCGRVFEGTAAMMHASLTKLSTLPGQTRVFCAHEYTMANMAFANAVEPNNQALQAHRRACADKRETNIPTVPSTIAVENATNPFLRCAEPEVISAAETRDAAGSDPVSVFAAIRGWKDQF